MEPGGLCVLFVTTPACRRPRLAARLRRVVTISADIFADELESPPLATSEDVAPGVPLPGPSSCYPREEVDPPAVCFHQDGLRITGG